MNLLTNSETNRLNASAESKLKHAMDVLENSIIKVEENGALSASALSAIGNVLRCVKKLETLQAEIRGLLNAQKRLDDAVALKEGNKE